MMIPSIFFFGTILYITNLQLFLLCIILCCVIFSVSLVNLIVKRIIKSVGYILMKFCRSIHYEFGNNCGYTAGK